MIKRYLENWLKCSLIFNNYKSYMSNFYENDLHQDRQIDRLSNDLSRLRIAGNDSKLEDRIKELEYQNKKLNDRVADNESKLTILQMRICLIAHPIRYMEGELVDTPFGRGRVINDHYDKTVAQFDVYLLELAREQRLFYSQISKVKKK